ncbi:hypothetical protein [Microvirga tunisiensis]|uniref:Uncharacterized protein n=1 Tax=Microvirga tunisiensis TaxID=2108360 RepID=A0A5N7MLK8_9HYPH|nr:hypothetical protein [Microvirga tunisiensis]MPR09743.1 hypothetical protein [Microvirga tunisiensis]MPR27905.1 hypothetical protein [Microvirga tunisiensis]
MSRTSVPEATSTAQAKRPGRPPVEDVEREWWGAMIRPDLLLGRRKLALDRGVLPYAVLDDAVEALLKKEASVR